MEKDRICDDDEMWVCAHCGKHVTPDRYSFDDESCMLNAVKVKAEKVHYKDDDPAKRVVRVD